MKKWLSQMLFFLCSCLLLSLISCASATTPAQPRTRHTAPPVVKGIAGGTLLYQANWSKGFASWKGDRGWMVVDGQLQSNSVASISIVTPYQPTVANYTVETRVRIVRVLKNVVNAFLIYANDQPGRDGFEGGVNTLAQREPSLPPPGFAQVAPDQLDRSAGFHQIDYVPSDIWHTYRIAVQGNEVSMYIDGTLISYASSLKHGISNGPIGLTSWGFELQVSSFRITAL